MIEFPLWNALAELDCDADVRRAKRVAVELVRERAALCGDIEALGELQVLWRLDCTKRSQRHVISLFEDTAKLHRQLGLLSVAEELERAVKLLRMVAAEPDWVDDPSPENLTPA